MFTAEEEERLELDVCPKCEHHDVEDYEFEHIDASVFVNRRCTGCGFAWSETFSFHEASPLEEEGD